MSSENISNDQVLVEKVHAEDAIDASKMPSNREVHREETLTKEFKIYKVQEGKVQLCTPMYHR